MESKIKFGFRIHQSGYSFTELKNAVTLADRLGYYSVTLYDLLGIPTLECWTTLSAFAGITENIRLTPMVLANLYRPPFLLAKMGATLDVISNGRFELGIGAGGSLRDHQSAGFAFPNTPKRVAMLEESVLLIKKLWKDDNTTFTGSFYQSSHASINPKPIQKPHPPLIIGGHGERHLLRSVAKYANICNIGSELSISEHTQKLELLEEHCQQVERDFSEIEVTHNTRIIIAKTTSDFEKKVSVLTKAAHMGREQYKLEISKSIHGTPDQCIQQIQSYVDYGIQYFFLIFPDPIHPDDLKLFSEHVMPAFS